MTRQQRFQLITTGIIIATIVGLVTYDIFTVSYAGRDTSISRIVIGFLWDHPAVAFAGGALCGHLTWSTDLPVNRRTELILLVLSLVTIVLVDVLRLLHPMLPVWPFAIGIPFGHAMWGQHVAPLKRAANALRRQHVSQR